MMSELNSLFEARVSSVMSNTVRGNAFRLDAGAYSAESIATQKLLSKSNLENKKLADIAEIFGFGPFKRTYIQCSQFGIPLLTSAEMMEISPVPKIMAKADLPNWSQYQVEKGWILVSCSGTIGNCAIVPEKWDDWSVSQDAIRVVPEKAYQGLIYAFLNLPSVKCQIVGSKSGSVIDHIYADDLRGLDIPIPDKEIIDELDQLVTRVLDLREESDNLLSNADVLINEINALPPLQEEDAIWLDEKKSGNAILIYSSDVTKDNHTGSEYRLDATFYNPMARLAIRNIKEAKNEVQTVGDVSERVFLVPRFKRNYVDQEYGTPFLSGKNIIQIRPTGLKYLSESETRNLEVYRLEESWTLITCSGTIGRTCFVWQNFEDYTATQHILRVVPDVNQVDPGYLYAFLSSQYGKLQVLRYSHGSVIDEITDKQISKVLIPLPSQKEQKKIGDLVRTAYEKRAEAIRLEDEAQEILMTALTQK